jgi:hypothetical protein
MVFPMTARGASTTRTVLIAVVVVGLAVDAYVHLHLAGATSFRANKTSTVSEAELFRIESVAAILAAVALLVRPNRYTAAFAFLVGAAGIAAVVVYRYVNVGKIGPIPNMYDPFWLPTEKWLSAIAEAAVALAALALLGVFGGRKIAR